MHRGIAGLTKQNLLPYCEKPESQIGQIKTHEEGGAARTPKTWGMVLSFKWLIRRTQVSWIRASLAGAVVRATGSVDNLGASNTDKSGLLIGQPKSTQPAVISLWQSQFTSEWRPLWVTDPAVNSAGMQTIIRKVNFMNWVQQYCNSQIKRSEQCMRRC